VKPHLILYVADATISNLYSIENFEKNIPIQGIIFTKVDIGKGGEILSIANKYPIYFLCYGQDYSDIEPFDREKFVDSLLK
jgi:signal recognition particle GTPase